MSQYSDLDFTPTDRNSSWTKIFNFIPEKSEVLDIGCSSGNFGAALIEYKNCIVDGLDYNPQDVKAARKVLRQAWVSDIEQDDLKKIVAGTKYDAIIMADVIEHLVDPVTALRGVKKLLKPNGFLAFSVPNMAHTWVRLSLLKGEFTHTDTGLLDKTHIHFYDVKELERVLDEAGFALERYDSTVVNIPRKMVRDRLSELGLGAEERFFDYLNDSLGHIYQFVGKVVAKPPGQVAVQTSHENLAITRSPAEDVHLYLSDLDRMWRDREIELLHQLRWRRPFKTARKVASKTKRRITTERKKPKK